MFYDVSDKALAKTLDTTRWQRCWVHMMTNILNKLSKSLQKRPKIIFTIKLFSKNLTSVLAFPTQATIDENNRNSLHQYQKNFVQVVSKVKDVLLLLFIRARSKVLTIISGLHAIVVK